MGIQGVDIKQELKALTKELPSILHQAAEQLQRAAVGRACTQYAGFVSAALGDAGDGSHSAAELLPAVHRVRQAHLEARAPAPDQDTSSSMSAQTREVPGGDAGKDMADTASSTGGAERHEAATGMCMTCTISEKAWQKPLHVWKEAHAGGTHAVMGPQQRLLIRHALQGRKRIRAKQRAGRYHGTLTCLLRRRRHRLWRAKQTSTGMQTLPQRETPVLTTLIGT